MSSLMPFICIAPSPTSARTGRTGCSTLAASPYGHERVVGHPVLDPPLDLVLRAEALGQPGEGRPGVADQVDLGRVAHPDVAAVDVDVNRRTA
jgi:hypothetical protein